MMPEQVRLLRELWKNKNCKENPILNEQELEDINLNIHRALHEGTTVTITYYRNCDYHKAEGMIVKIDSFNRKIKLDKEDQEEIAIDDIIHVTLT